MSVASPTAQSASTQPPPMPTQADEYSSCPRVCWVARGTTQSAATWVNVLPPCSSVPWLYPDQLLDWLALSDTIVPPRGVAAAPDGMAWAGPGAAAAEVGKTGRRMVLRWQSTSWGPPPPSPRGRLDPSPSLRSV